MEELESNPRIGVVGAGRTRNGTGPFVAASLRRAGAELVAVATSSYKSATSAASALTAGGARCEPWFPPERMLYEAPIDAVAICSPLATHLRYLQIALDRRLHVFCEKPLFAIRSGADLRLAGKLVAAFAAKGCVLHLNTQWTFTVEDFLRLHQLESLPTARRLRVELAPSVTGLEMLLEALPHANSLLLALRPEVTRIRNVEYTWMRNGEGIHLAFVGSSARGPLDATYLFRYCPLQPRPAAYEINDLRADRVVTISNGYRIFLRAAHRTIRIRDPLDKSVDHFLATMRNGTRERNRSIFDTERMNLHILRMVEQQSVEQKTNPIGL
ncbi:MAG: Gfo/Idh/MocA family oxidoreductase [Egibacteraceae bacterium]